MGERKDGEFIPQSLLLAGFFAGHINQGDLSIISNGAGLADRSAPPSRARSLPADFTMNFLRVFVFVGSL